MYRKRSRDQEIEEIIDGEIMDWDLEEFGWESSTDHLDHDDQLDSDHHLLLLDFINSSSNLPQKSTSQLSSELSPIKPHDHHNQTMKLSRDSSAMDTFSPSSGAPKRPINTSIASQKMSCSVDGCNADLSGCRDYHRRHRVCERHSKTPIVIVKGEEKRFCQQCSRFHSLGEFDEVKRSCRKRLDGHNRRRRKSQPEPLYFGFKGPRILHFGNPQLYATASVRTLWPVETKSGSESWIYSPHNHNPKRVQVTNKPSPQISFDATALKKNITLKPVLNHHTNSSEQSFSRPFEPSNGRVRIDNPAIHDEQVSLPIDSGGRALYLLSTNPTHQRSMQHQNEACSIQILDYDYKDKPPLEPFPSHSYYNAANSEEFNDTNMMIRMGPDGLLEHEALQMLPISLD